MDRRLAPGQGAVGVDQLQGAYSLRRSWRALHKSDLAFRVLTERDPLSRIS